jgi:aldose 1-epimerase
MTAPPDTVELQSGPLRLALRADLGGCIAGLWREGLPVLRSTEPGALESSRLSACYPLVPYSGRLGYRRFRWHGQDHTTAANNGDAPHSIHGVAWQRPWQVVQAEATRAVLELQHQADADWPFPFSARQTFELSPQGLRVALEVHNTGSQPQPVGLGWHPYFPKRSRSRIHAEAAVRWETDAGLLPTRPVASSGVDGDVAHLQFDHGFAGWKGPARVRDEALHLELHSGLSWLVVFTPPMKDYFCVEPVSHLANAVHMSQPAEYGLVDLAPGASTAGWMRLDIAAAK